MISFGHRHNPDKKWVFNPVFRIGSFEICIDRDGILVMAGKRWYWRTDWPSFRRAR